MDIFPSIDVGFPWGNSPLVAAPDATVIDSTGLSEDEVLQRVEGLVQRKMAG